MTPTQQQAGAVLGVLALLAATLWGLRRSIATWPIAQWGAQWRAQWGAQWRARLTGPAAAPALRVRAQMALTPQHRLHQIETAAGECYLLATHPGGVTVITAASMPGESRPIVAPRNGARAAGRGT